MLWAAIVNAVLTVIGWFKPKPVTAPTVNKVLDQEGATHAEDRKVSTAADNAELAGLRDPEGNARAPDEFSRD